MSLKFGNTTIEKLIKDGTEIRDLNFGGTKVFKKRRFTSNFTFHKEWMKEIAEPSIPPVSFILFDESYAREVKRITINNGDYTLGPIWETYWASRHMYYYHRIVTANKSIAFDVIFPDDSKYYSLRMEFNSAWYDRSTTFQYVPDLIFNGKSLPGEKLSTNKTVVMYPINTDYTVTFYTSDSETTEKLTANTSPSSVPIYNIS